MENSNRRSTREIMSSGDSKTSLEYSSVTKTVSCSLDTETVGSKGVNKRSEFIKIITSSLYSLGYNKNDAALEEESGIPLHPSKLKLLEQLVTEGKWEECVGTLSTTDLWDGETIKLATFLLLEQKFLDLLKMVKVNDATRTLREEIVPLGVNMTRVSELSSCLTAPPERLILGQDVGDANSRLQIVEKLKNLLPPSVLVLRKRLEHLLEMALYTQRNYYRFHNIPDADISLCSDHLCGKNYIPSETLQVKEDGQVSLKHRLNGHQKPVLSVSWSPDDRSILTLGKDKMIMRWDVESGVRHCEYTHEFRLVSCGWMSDGESIFAGTCNRSIRVRKFDGQTINLGDELDTGVEILDVILTDTGREFIELCSDNVIRIFDGERQLVKRIAETEIITSFALSRDNRFLLVNLLNQEIHLWLIEGDPKFCRIYNGKKCSRFIIRSCFGGFQESFVASGSEDSQVYIWYRRSGELLFTLPGHSGAVNCVSWNPGNLHMLASCTDDHTIRIWGLRRTRT